MSQSPNPADSQALLQSMLQKLKLQSEREGQGHRHTLGPENSSPGTNGIHSNKVRSPAADNNFNFKFSHLQQPGHGGGVDRGFISFPSQKDNSVGDTGDSRVMGQATQPVIAPTVTGQLFPTTSLKDASFERTDSEKWSFGNSAMKRSMPPNTDAAQSMGVNENQEQGFKPKVYLWAAKNTDPFAGGHDNKALIVGNGGFGAMAENKDTQVASDSQKTTNSSVRRKQRSSENKTRRWTQRLKERWKDRQGKKGKEEEGSIGDQKSGEEPEVSSVVLLYNDKKRNLEVTLQLVFSRIFHTQTRLQKASSMRQIRTKGPSVHWTPVEPVKCFLHAQRTPLTTATSGNRHTNDPKLHKYIQTCTLAAWHKLKAEQFFFGFICSETSAVRYVKHLRCFQPSDIFTLDVCLWSEVPNTPCH